MIWGALGNAIFVTKNLKKENFWTYIDVENTWMHVEIFPAGKSQLGDNSGTIWGKFSGQFRGQFCGHPGQSVQTFNQYLNKF